MTLTIEHNNQSYLNPKSLEFWKLIDPRFKYLFKLSFNSPFYLTWDHPVDRKAIRMLPENGEWYDISPFNIYHPGTWEDSLYQRPELANESTPEGSDVIVWDVFNKKYFLTQNIKGYRFDLHKAIIATDAMRKQYLGGK